MEFKRRPQKYVTYNGTQRFGEVIRHHNADGFTGYIDWTGEECSEAGVKTASMLVVGFTFAIEVRNRDQDLGSQLFTELIHQLSRNNYQQLLILGAIESAKGFYDKVLQRLQKSGTITSFVSEARYDTYRFQILDYTYRVFLSRVFLRLD